MTSYPRSETLADMVPVFTKYHALQGQSTTYPTAVIAPVENNVALHIGTLDDAIHTRYPFEGGDCCIRKVTYHHGFVDNCKAGYSYQNPTTKVWYVNFQWDTALHAPNPTALPTPTTLNTQASSYGTEAWSRFAPKPHVADIGQTFYELKETFFSVRNIVKSLPHLGKMTVRQFDRFATRARKQAHDTGAAYLSWHFGWKPFVQDVIKVVHGVRNFDTKMAKIRKENGQWIHRRGTLRNTTTRSTSGSGACIYPRSTAYFPSTVMSYDTTTTEYVGFSGCFRYYVPGLEDRTYLGRARTYIRAFGLNLTPKLVWNLVPWTWMANWFSNVGQVVGNYSDINEHQLVAKYAYITRRSKTRCLAKCTFQTKFRSTYKPTTYDVATNYGEAYTDSETYTRVGASPFGFSVGWDGLNSFQLSILAALGVTRAL